MCRASRHAQILRDEEREDGERVVLMFTAALGTGRMLHDLPLQRSVNGPGTGLDNRLRRRSRVRSGFCCRSPAQGSLRGTIRVGLDGLFPLLPSQGSMSVLRRRSRSCRCSRRPDGRRDTAATAVRGSRNRGSACDAIAHDLPFQCSIASCSRCAEACSDRQGVRAEVAATEETACCLPLDRTRAVMDRPRKTPLPFQCSTSVFKWTVDG